MRLVKYGLLGIGLCSLLSSCAGDDSENSRKLSLLTQTKDGECHVGNEVCLAIGEGVYECGCYDPDHAVPEEQCVEQGGRQELLMPVATEAQELAETSDAEEPEEDLKSGACILFPAEEKREEICTEFTSPELANCDPLAVECFLALDEETKEETIACFCNESYDGEVLEPASEVCVLDTSSELRENP